MSTFVLVHGAFRGGWSWDRVAPLLRAAGHEVHTPTLSGTASALAVWVEEVVAATGGEPAVLVGHSQGGVVVREVAVRHPELAAHLVYLDAAVPDAGERAVDVAPTPVDDSLLPPRDTIIPARPLAAGGDLDEDTAAWMNERLVATPFGPSLDPASAGEPEASADYAFCAGTPDTYPSGTTRRRLDERGTAYAVLDAGHDAPVTRPDLVAELLFAACPEDGTDRRRTA